MQLTNTFTEVIINVIPSTLKNSGTTDIEIALSNEVPTQGDYSLAPNQYYNIENNTKKLWARAKVTEGTVTLLNFRHLEPLPPLFLGSQPHPSLVLGVHATPQGLFSYNRFDDKMPFKTKDNAGLQILEETPDYIQYICKNAIFTTVQKYVPGVYQTFMERMIDIESSNDLIKSYNIEWTHEDNSNLFIQLNNEALEKLESQPMMLPIEGEEPTQPIVLEPKTVPTTYDCCFTVRKDDNYSLYINEGYENLFPINIFFDYGNGYFYKSLKNPNSVYNVLKMVTSVPNLKYYVKYEEVKNVGINDMKVHINQGSLPTLTIQPSDRISDYGGIITTVTQAQFQIRFDALEVNTEIKFDIKKPIIVNSNTQKPFVKTIQPNCKLAFETFATSETHSFIMKGIEQNVSDYFVIYSCDNNFTDQLYSRDRTTKPYNVYRSKSFKPQLTGDDATYLGVTKGLLLIGAFRGITTSSINSFKQLLIYKGNLAEAELKAELSKGFKLNPNLYLYPDNILGEIFTRIA